MDAFQPRTSYSHYNHYKKATSSHLSAKNVTSNEWIDNLPLNCPSPFKGGPSPFIGYQYNKDHTLQSLDFSNQKSENHFFDRHGESALNLKGNRNKETLAKTRTKLVEFASEPDTKRVEGSFRYEKPVYHYLKDSPGARAKNNLILTVDAQTNQPISVRNVTKYQFDQIDRNGNLGLDARPVKPSGEEGFSVVLRLHGGPSF